MLLLHDTVILKEFDCLRLTFSLFWHYTFREIEYSARGSWLIFSISLLSLPHVCSVTSEVVPTSEQDVKGQLVVSEFDQNELNHP